MPVTVAVSRAAQYRLDGRVRPNGVARVTSGSVCVELAPRGQTQVPPTEAAWSASSGAAGSCVIASRIRAVSGAARSPRHRLRAVVISQSSTSAGAGRNDRGADRRERTRVRRGNAPATKREPHRPRILPKACRSPRTPPIWRWWLPTSTTDPARSTIGRSTPRHSPNSSREMLPPTESAGYCTKDPDLTLALAGRFAAYHGLLGRATPAASR